MYNFSNQLTIPRLQQPDTKQRLTVSSLATIYGGCGLFGLCGSEDLITLTMAGTNPFFDWIRWVGSDEHLIERNFIHWIRPTESPRVGYVSDPCADPNSVEFGKATWRYEGFGRLRRSAPVTDVTQAYLKYCVRQPRYRLDGTVIDNDIEYRALLAAEGISQDTHVLSIVGNKSTAGQFDGLERLVKTGYTDANGKRVSSMDSIVIDWNNNTMAGGSGITWDDGRVGTISIATNQTLVDVLRDAFTQVRARLKMAPTLGAANLRVGDVIIMGTSEACSELMDQFTFWSLEPGRQYHEISYNNLQARNYRDSLDGGLFGDGRIFFKSFEIPLLAYDWELQKGPNRSDMYMLVRGVGSTVMIEGQFNNMTRTAANHRKFEASDGGRFLHWEEDDHTCLQHIVELQPRIISWAPWANVRIQNVTVTANNGHTSPDPLETSFFPETSFVTAAC